jgi:hypothetical protein
MNIALKSVLAAIAIVSVSSPVHARNDRTVHPIAAALKGVPLDRTTPIHFGTTGGQAIGPVKASVRVPVGGNPPIACGRALAEAVAQLQAKTKQLGGTAVGSIVSIHGHTKMTGNVEFQCGVGFAQTHVILEGVAMRGR